MTYSARNVKGLDRPVILALETATMCGSVALVAGDSCLAEFSLQTGETHSRRLLTAIDRLLQQSGIEWSGIAAVAVSQGPGSFTGLRIGLATAKGLAMAGNLKLIGINTLDGLAGQLFGTGQILICPVLDARKKEVYCGFYRADSRNIPRCLGENLVVGPEVLCDRIVEPVVMLGDGAGVYGDLFRKNLAGLLTVAPPGIYFPRASSIGMLALEKLQKNEFLDPAGAEPIYIRPSEAELSLGKGRITAAD